MISYLGSPTVCVVDDEQTDYEPVIAALLELGVACVHFRGRNEDPLPSKPLESIRLVFTDLHLSGQLGKAAAAHTANVIRKIVPADKGPVLIVIWSKYASDPAVDNGAPPDDQPTEAEMFKETLLGADGGYKSRLMFTEMAKPKKLDRPPGRQWTEELKDHIQETLKRAEAFQALWVWESLLRRSGTEVEEALIALAEQKSAPGEVEQTLRLILRHLAQLQAGPDLAEGTICKHLMAVFSQLGADSVEAGASSLDPPYQPEWLCEPVSREEKARLDLSKKLNGLLQTASTQPAAAQFVPGTLFTVTDLGAMTAATGFTIEALVEDCYEGNAANRQAFQNSATPVLLELTPACDFHQGNRRSAAFVAGLLFPASQKHAKNKDACKTVPLFEDRYQTPPVEVGVVFCARYRCTLPLTAAPTWLAPRIRFREGLLTDLRNWASAQAARAGYLIV